MRPSARQRRSAGRPDLRKLRRVHGLLAIGEARRAAAILQRLGDAARRKRRPRAGLLFVAAGRAHLQSGERELAVEAFRKGFGLMAALGQSRRLDAVGGQVLEQLKAKGMETQAEALGTELRKGHPELDFRAAQGAKSASTVHLPPVCPHCGAPIHPEELEDSGGGTLRCAYCGLSIRAGGA